MNAIVPRPFPPQPRQLKTCFLELIAKRSVPPQNGQGPTNSPPDLFSMILCSMAMSARLQPATSRCRRRRRGRWLRLRALIKPRVRAIRAQPVRRQSAYAPDAPPRSPKSRGGAVSSNVESVWRCLISSDPRCGFRLARRFKFSPDTVVRGRKIGVGQQRHSWR